MASIRDVAKQAGVSIATVSRVLNGHGTVAPHLRKQVLEAVDRCAYTPAVGLRSQKSIALIYTGPFTPGSPYDSACIEGMVDAMRHTPYDLAIIDLRRDKAPDETYRQFFARKGICGAIVRSTAAERKLVERMAADGLPMVMLGDHYENAPLPFVYADSSAASRQAIEHLVSLGHTRIAFAACEREDGDHRDRFEAYRATLESRGLMHPDLVGHIPPHRMDGEKLIRNLLGLPHRPTAVFIADPLVAVGAINEAHRMGVKIPDELSIIGVDDTDIRSLIYPKMTAVCQDSHKLGQLALESVVSRVSHDGKKHEPPRSHPAWLEINETTAPPPEVAYHVLPNRSRVPSGRHATAQ
jgi:DNA-binding LacI/PurR family transcriptional regulator